MRQRINTLGADRMKSSFSTRLAIVFALSAVAACGETIPLTDGPPFTFRGGTDLFVRFSVWNYGANNRGFSPYPTSVGLQLIGAQPSSSEMEVVPSATDMYFTGYKLRGWLENSEGTISTPFTSLASNRLGLAPGSLVVQPGSFGSSERPVAVIEADAALTTTLSEEIFGIDVMSRASSAVIHLRNEGSDLEIGLDGGYSVLSAVRIPSVSGEGAVQTSGIMRDIAFTEVPEPRYFGMVLLSSLFPLSRFIKRWRKGATGRQ